MNDFALGVILNQLWKATWKSPIDSKSLFSFTVFIVWFLAFSWCYYYHYLIIIIIIIIIICYGRLKVLHSSCLKGKRKI